MARPKKKWGQNFLRTRGAVEKIVAAVQPAPGEGALTGMLLALGAPVVAFEIDPDLAARLRRQFGDRLDVRNEDALEAVMPDRPYRAVGNLPYNVGTPILRRVIADPNCRRAVFMLQREVAQRLVANPGDDEYGFLTLFRELHASATLLMKLGPKSFFPAPKVDSAVVVLDPRPRTYVTEGDVLLDLVSNAFRMRRKKLINNLIGYRELDRAKALAAMEKAGIDPDVRAEELGLAAFDRLAAAL